MNFAESNLVKLNNYNHLVPDPYIYGFLDKMVILREFAEKYDSSISKKEKLSSDYKNTQIYIEKCKKIHGNKYCYPYTVYLNESTDVIVFCKSCVSFFHQTPNEHIQNGCSYCKRMDQLAREEISQSDFEIIAKKRHKHTNYDAIRFKSYNNIVENILCTLCGEYFDILGHAHIRPVKPDGCPNCSRSKAKIRAEKYLIKKGINFDKQFKDPTLNFVNDLKIDYMLKFDDFMLAIELNGKHHYKHVNITKNMELNIRNLELYMHGDKSKVNWCFKRGIPLLVISYLDFHKIPELIEAFILENINKQQDNPLNLEM